MFHFLQLVTSILFWEGLIFRWYNYNPEMAVLNIHDRCLLNWNTFGIKFTFPLFMAETNARFYSLFPLLLLKTEKYSWLSVEFSPILEILIPQPPSYIPTSPAVCMPPGLSKHIYKLYAMQHPSRNVLEKLRGQGFSIILC